MTKNSEQILTIQATSKTLKLHLLIAIALIVAGILVAILSSSQNVSAIGTLTTVAGVIWFGVTKFRIWWNHR